MGQEFPTEQTKLFRSRSICNSQCKGSGQCIGGKVILGQERLIREFYKTHTQWQAIVLALVYLKATIVPVRANKTLPQLLYL